MKVIKPKDLYSINYSVDVSNSLRQFWDIHRDFSCIGKPKVKNMLLYLEGMDAEYALPDGTKIYAREGDLVYCPVGSEYYVDFSHKNTKDANTVGINFLIFDENMSPIILDKGIKVYKAGDVRHIINKINLASEFSPPCYAQMKSGVFDIISILGKKQKNKTLRKFKVIEKGISYMEEDPHQSLSIGEIAKMCNVSEIYFRKLFREYSGLSPIEYRIARKIRKAQSLLEFDDLNTTETAQLLGFSDCAYFCKQFKAVTGMTPLQYKDSLYSKSE